MKNMLLITTTIKNYFTKVYFIFFAELLLKFIHPEYSHPPLSSYTPGILSNNLLFISGQLPIDLKSKMIIHKLDKVTLLTLNHIEKILEEVNLNRNSIIQITIYLKYNFLNQRKRYKIFNQQYSHFFKKS